MKRAKKDCMQKILNLALGVDCLLIRDGKQWRASIFVLHSYKTTLAPTTSKARAVKAAKVWVSLAQPVAGVPEGNQTMVGAPRWVTFP